MKTVFRSDLYRADQIIVAGGGSGIGRCTAGELVQLGAHVILLGRNEEKLARAKTELRKSGGTADYFVCDLREAKQVKKVMDQLERRKFKITGVVNSAGGQFSAKLIDMSVKGFEAVVRNNLLANFIFTQEVVRRFLIKSGGSIVNILADFSRGMPLLGHSGAARAAIENLTKTAAVEWAEHGIRINSIAPGIIASSGLDSYGPHYRKLINGLKTEIPMKRFGTVEEISSLAVFLLSPAASYITGVTVAADGALSLWNPKMSDSVRSLNV